MSNIIYTVLFTIIWFIQIILIVEVFNSRGYFAVGSEWFFSPLCFCIILSIFNLIRKNRNENK